MSGKENDMWYRGKYGDHWYKATAAADDDTSGCTRLPTLLDILTLVYYVLKTILTKKTDVKL